MSNDQPQNLRPLSADDLVGIIIHNTNQLASYLSVHGTLANFDDVAAKMIGMYADVERIKAMLAAQSALDDDAIRAN